MRLAILSAFIFQGVSLVAAGWRELPATSWNDCSFVEQSWNETGGDKDIICKDGSGFKDAVAACIGTVDNAPDATEQQKKDKNTIFPLLTECD